MRCNTKQKLIGKQTTQQAHKKTNGKYDWNPETTELEIVYHQQSICENGHIQDWGYKKPITNIKWKCSRRITIKEDKLGWNYE